MIALGIAPAKWVRFLSVAHSLLTASALTSAELPAEGVGVCWGALGLLAGQKGHLDARNGTGGASGGLQERRSPCLGNLEGARHQKRRGGPWRAPGGQQPARS